MTKKESYYAEMVRKTKESAARDFGHHMIRDGLVRSFRFNGSTVTRELERPPIPFPIGKMKNTFVEKANISLSSNYAFTLTWTPGHLTLAGDVGEMVITHYHAMPTLEEATHWALSSDFDYLLSKSDKKKVYNRDETLKQFKAYVYEEVREEMFGRWSQRYAGNDENGKPTYKRYHTGGVLGELRAWRKQEPTWNKCRRAGMKRAEFEAELKYWQEDKPRVLYLEERKRGRFDTPYFKFGEDRPSDFWEYPDCLDRLVRLYLHFNQHWQGDIKGLLTNKGRWKLWEEVDRAMDSENAAYEVAYGVYGDDPYVSRTYTWRDFYQITAIQHGCRMIRQQLGLEARKEAA